MSVHNPTMLPPLHRTNPAGFMPLCNPVGGVPCFNPSPKGTYVGKLMVFVNRDRGLLLVTERAPYGRRINRVKKLTPIVGKRLKARMYSVIRITQHQRY